MNGDLELGWLRLADKSELVFTTVHLFQYDDRGIFGETKTIIPREAIATVRVAWHRSKALLVLGLLLLTVFLVLMIGSILAGPAEIASGQQTVAPAEGGAFLMDPAMSYARGILSSSVGFFVQYGSLAGAIAIFALFWFHKRAEIQITAAGGTVGGIPRSYEEAEKFCTMLLSETGEYPAPGKKDELEVKGKPAAVKSDWHL